MTIPIPVPSPPRRVQSHPRNNSINKKLILFSTPPRYSPFVWFLISVPLIVVGSQIALLGNNGDGGDYRQSSQAWILGWAFILVVVLYMAVLPKQIDVRSNGTVTIKTFLLTFHFDSIVRAYQAGLGREDFLRPRLKFATTLGVPAIDTCCDVGGIYQRLKGMFCLKKNDTTISAATDDTQVPVQPPATTSPGPQDDSKTSTPSTLVIDSEEGNEASSIDGIIRNPNNTGSQNEESTNETGGRVVIRRSHGKWDVVVTPKDPEGFCDAVTKMVSMIEQEQLQEQEQQQQNDGGPGSSLNNNGTTNPTTTVAGVLLHDLQPRSGTPAIDGGVVGRPDLASTSTTIC
mmetsp:Transcript_60908/g.149127  ORF Transcript_60908/g.149127 Transcript_60908/m.149127 type:complete len:345 (-) Transcript_60908:34-1068(-)